MGESPEAGNRRKSDFWISVASLCVLCAFARDFCAQRRKERKENQEEGMQSSFSIQ
jgi:hypothetical protein